ncbi:olfactory receptor 14A2-like [Ailuropoda melanoleuca]|uniref:olfactory receptor 14A2-like n=1 Tax=Ailuropoda melanoleuca TaxID=9646 RepID=UPI0014940C62|nr:olfactory receptor 14A2-like [Ailuropoda melanoleuca]
MTNVTLVAGFLLVGFSDIQELQIVYGVLFLVIYLAILMSNLIIILTTLDLQQQTTMYFFPKNLSFLDVFLVSAPIPNFIVNNIDDSNSITTLGCAFQLLLMTSFSEGEVFVLPAMSYDCYVAICCPLHYEVIMNGDACVLMAGFSWAVGGLLGALYTAGTFFMPFSGSNVIPQFFCDVYSLLRNSCSETLLIVYTNIGIGLCLGMSCFICIVISYVCIFSTMLKISITKGQSKAFSTCFPHLIIFTLFIITACFVYLKPSSNPPTVIDRLLSVIYTVVPPILNPVIYSLRKKDMKRALMRLLHKTCGQESHSV